MRGTITWKNINTPNFGSANNLLRQSSQDIGNGLSALGNVATNVNQENKDYVSRIAQQNTDTLLSEINQFEDLANAQAFEEQMLSRLKGIDPTHINKKTITDAVLGRESAIRNDLNNQLNTLTQNMSSVREQEDLLLADRLLPYQEKLAGVQGKMSEAITSADPTTVLAETKDRLAKSTGLSWFTDFFDIDGPDEVHDAANDLIDNNKYTAALSKNATASEKAIYDVVSQYANNPVFQAIAFNNAFLSVSKDGDNSGMSRSDLDDAYIKELELLAEQYGLYEENSTLQNQVNQIKANSRQQLQQQLSPSQQKIEALLKKLT